jgi:hypothetical protein
MPHDNSQRPNLVKLSGRILGILALKPRSMWMNQRHEGEGKGANRYMRIRLALGIAY